MVIIRADTKRFTQRRCQKIDIKNYQGKNHVKGPSDS